MAGRDWSERLADGCRAAEVPGAVLAIRADGHTEVATYGVLDTRSEEPVTAGSVFQLGSITKLGTATMIGQLVAEGRLAWDATVADVLPGVPLPGGSDQITLRHLLTHGSGIDGDVFDDTGVDGDYQARYLALLEETPSLFAPGAAYSYCNAGFVVLGAVISRLDERAWDESWAARIATPLGWRTRTTFRTQSAPSGAAYGHRERPHADEPVTTWALPRAIDPAGGGMATATELLELGTALFSAGDGRLVPDEIRAEMVREQVPTPALQPNLDGIGLAVRRHRWDGGLLLGHDGSTIGQCAYLRVAPERGFAVALLTNGAEADAMAQGLAADVVGDYLGWAPHEPIAPLPIGERAPATDRWVGRYARVAATYEVTRDPEDDHALVARSVTTGAAAELLERDEHRLRLLPARTDGSTDGRSFVGRLDDGDPWGRWTFDDRPGVGPHVLVGGRVTPQVDGETP